MFTQLVSGVGSCTGLPTVKNPVTAHQYGTSFWCFDGQKTPQDRNYPAAKLWINQSNQISQSTTQSYLIDRSIN